MPRGLLALALAALALGAVAPGCFKPEHPACAFSCTEPPHTCPSGFTCGADYLCHDLSSNGICGIELSDASASDVGVGDRGQ